MQAHPQKLWLVANPGKITENPSKILETLDKIPENLGKTPENPGKNGDQRLQKNTKTHEDLFWRTYQKRSS